MWSNEKLLTVIVPVYKVEAYIVKCLESLIVPEPWMSRLEVIIVNDGTPDQSAEMSRQFTVRYPNTFRQIDKENGGHGSAWNRGLSEASGKYVRFLDSDDWYSTPDFMKLLMALDTLDVDMVISNYNRYYVQKDTFEPMLITKVKAGVIYDAATFPWTEQPWEVANFWRCTWRTGMLQKEQPLFVEKVFYDDTKTQVAAVMLADTVCYLDLNIYNYLLGRPGQTMSPENQRKNYLHKFTTQKDIFDFYLSHTASGEERNRYLTEKIKSWLLYEFYQLSRFPYQESRKYLSEWKAYYQKLADRIGFTDYPLNTVRLFFTLPFPVYYYSRKIKDTLFSKDKEVGYSNWVEA